MARPSDDEIRKIIEVEKRKERLNNSMRAQAAAQRGAEEWHESVVRDSAAHQAQDDRIPEVEPAIIGEEVPAGVVRPTVAQRLCQMISRCFGR